MNIEFARAYVLIGIPAALLLLILSARFMYVKNKSQRIREIAMRCVIVTLLLLALSGMSIKWKGNAKTTVFLLDISDSMKENREDMLKFVAEAIKEKDADDSIGVVAFGSDAKVEQFVSAEAVFSEFQTEVVKTATNLENAVDTALAMMPEDSAKRLVLISDGVENEGNIKDTISSIATAKCLVEVVKLDTVSSEEVYVSDIKVPDSVASGENFSISVKIESNVACEAVVTLYSGRTLKARQTVNLQKGMNTFTFKDTQSEEGLKTYRVQVDAVQDTISVNNEYLAYTNISTRKPLLVIEGSSGEANELSKVLDSINVSYNVVHAATAPSTLSEMNEYGGIITVNVHADDLRLGFLDNIEAYVKDYGGGFISAGGRNSYALGNYNDTPLENILPVDMELQGENEIPTIAMMLVIDKSGSMSAGNGVVTNLDLAKEAAVAALDNLRDDDYIGVIAFDDSYDKVVKLQKASDRENISNSIYGINIEGGTSIYPALAAAVQEISDNPAKIKHIILLTDGQDGYDQYGQVIGAINANNITLSTVAVGEGCNFQLLNSLAEKCNGRYYYTDINSDIPRIFAQEVFLSANSYLVDGVFTPIITSNDEVISEVAANGLPNLLGYVATTRKARATQLLESSEGDPLLCMWQYGLGKTVAWMSDVDGKWSQNWSGWDNTSLLWHNMIQYITDDMGMEGAYAEIEQNGSTATIKYVTEDYGSTTSVKATVYDDNGNSEVITLDPVSPGVYTTDFIMDGTGVYSINIRQEDGGEVIGSVNTATMMQYSLEYRFYDESTVLEEYTRAVGGNMITAATEVFDEELDMVKQRMDIGTTLLIIAAVLFVIDIAVRRFRIKLPELKRKNKASATAAVEENAANKEKDSIRVKKAAAKKEKQTEEAAKPDKPRKDKKDKKDKKPDNTSERLDTSQLLNRMKK